jgi:hypothetical protein
MLTIEDIFAAIKASTALNSGYVHRHEGQFPNFVMLDGKWDMEKMAQFLNERLSDN